jgi:hypothetical protein
MGLDGSPQSSLTHETEEITRPRVTDEGLRERSLAERRRGRWPKRRIDRPLPYNLQSGLPRLRQHLNRLGQRVDPHDLLLCLCGEPAGALHGRFTSEWPKPPSRLALEKVGVSFVTRFLERLERQRGNCARFCSTRKPGGLDGNDGLAVPRPVSATYYGLPAESPG